MGKFHHHLSSWHLPLLGIRHSSEIGCSRMALFILLSATADQINIVYWLAHEEGLTLREIDTTRCKDLLSGIAFISKLKWLRYEPFLWVPLPTAHTVLYFTVYMSFILGDGKWNTRMINRAHQVTPKLNQTSPEQYKAQGPCKVVSNVFGALSGVHS